MDTKTKVIVAVTGTVGVILTGAVGGALWKYGASYIGLPNAKNAKNNDIEGNWYVSSMHYIDGEEIKLPNAYEVANERVSSNDENKEFKGAVIDALVLSRIGWYNFVIKNGNIAVVNEYSVIDTGTYYEYSQNKMGGAIYRIKNFFDYSKMAVDDGKLYIYVDKDGSSDVEYFECERVPESLLNLDMDS